jgi:transcriptional regulator with XRE-family HTH domain
MPTLNKVIKDSGLSFREIAIQTGFSTNSLLQWRKGRIPRLQSIRKLEAFFGVNNIVFEESGPEPSKKAKDSVQENGPLNAEFDEETGLVQISGAEQFTLMQIIRRIGFNEAMRRLIQVKDRSK